MRQGRLREDLFHRIRVLILEVPPLRERLEDLPDLVDLFLREGEGPAPELAGGVIEELSSLEWPGNVRELKNLATRLRFEHPERISVEDIRGSGSRRSAPLLPRSLLSVEPLEKLKDRIERDYLLFHLRRLQGDKARLSRLLGLSLTHTYRRLKQLGIDVREERRKGWER
jgi:two-component system nitrogen regulation response regulator NtrX